MSRLLTKPTKWHVRPAKTQISLGIRPVWSVFAVCMKKAWADLSLRWAHMPFCWFCHEAAHINLHVMQAYLLVLSAETVQLQTANTIQQQMVSNKVGPSFVQTTIDLLMFMSFNFILYTLEIKYERLNFII